MLADLLKTLLGTQAAYYVKAHGFHWNVETPDFYQYHKFFQKIYEDAYSAIDPIAEYIRSLDEYAPGSLDRFLELSIISGQTKVPRARLMIEELLANSSAIINRARGTLVCPEITLSSKKRSRLPGAYSSRLLMYSAMGSMAS